MAPQQPYGRFPNPAEKAVAGAEVFRDHRVDELAPITAAAKPPRGRVDEGKRGLKRDINEQHKLIDGMAKKDVEQQARIRELESQIQELRLLEDRPHVGEQCLLEDKLQRRTQALLGDVCRGCIEKQARIIKLDECIADMKSIHKEYEDYVEKTDNALIAQFVNDRFEERWPKYRDDLEATYQEYRAKHSALCDQYRAGCEKEYELSKQIYENRHDKLHQEEIERLKAEYEQRERDLAKQSMSIIDRQEAMIKGLESGIEELAKSKLELEESKKQLPGSPEATIKADSKSTLPTPTTANTLSSNKSSTGYADAVRSSSNESDWTLVAGKPKQRRKRSGKCVIL